MRVRASTILTFALLSAAPVFHAVAAPADSRTHTKDREHPVAAKAAKAGSNVKGAALTSRPSRAPERAAALRTSSHAHPAKEIARKEPTRAENLRQNRGAHAVAAKEERDDRGRRRVPERKIAVAQTESRNIVRGKAEHVEPVKIARAYTVPIVRAEPEEPPTPPAAIESDPEAATVSHDRKIHHSPGGDDEPRKATSADFMNETPEKPTETRPLPPPPAPLAAVTRPKVTLVLPTPVARTIPAAIAKATATPEPPPVLVSMVYRHGKLVVPPALKGSHEILLHQNEMADEDGLGRVQNDDDLDALRAGKLLVPIPAVAGMQVDERLPSNRRYCRPWTAQFLEALARAHYARFHTALQVNSAVRTVEFQQRLLLTNGNAAPAEGETASPHLTGQAVDLAKKGLSMTEIAWLRGYLLPLVQQGKVDVEEEFQQACFHVSVYKKYMPQPAPKRTIVPHRVGATALATALP